MADGRCLNADILASLLLGNNEAFAKEVVDLANRLNAAKIMSSRGNKTLAKNIEKNVKMQINGIVSSRILMGDAWKEAKESLMKTVRHKWWTIWEWAKLLELIDWISLANADEYAWLLFKEWADAGTKQEAINGFKKAVADYVASKNQLNKNFWTKITAKTKELKDRTKFIWILWKTEKKQAKAAAKKWEKVIPKEMLSPDETWKSIVNLMESDKKDSEILFNNYVLWRIFLWEDEDILVDFLRVEWQFKNTMPTLTIEDIRWFRTIDALIERVYTNALDIARDKDLRKELKLKLLELIQWQSWTKANQYKRAINVINTLMLANTWLSFSTTLKYSNIWQAIREVLVDENWYSRVSDMVSNESLYEELKELLERDKLLLWDKDNPRHIEAFWTKITWEELLKIIYAASWDESVKAAIDLAWDVSDDVIIKFAWAKLFWINQKQWEKNMKDLLKKFRKPYNVTEVSSIAFKATSWRNVVPTNNTSIAFVNFNKAENALNVDIENDALLSRSRFNDDLSNLYTLTVTTDTIPSYDISDWIEGLSDDVLKNIEYIVLPNGNRKTDYRLTRLKKRLKTLGNDKYQIIYPKSRQSWQYFVDVDWRLKFKTTSKKLYDEMSNKLAIESFNSATIDLTENNPINRKLMNLSNEQKKQALNDSAMDFFRHYMWTAWEWLSDEQLIRKISLMTGIPIDDAWTTNWELAQRVLYNNYTATWRYSKQVVTEADIDDIIAKIDNYNEADLIKALTDDGFVIDKHIVKKNLSIIKEAYKNLKTTWDLTEYIWYKWVVNWLSNKNSVTDIWTIEFQKILTSPNPREELAKYLYWDRTLSESEYKSVEDYLWDILDSFVSKMVDNLTKDWYQIPMVSPRRAMMDYLRWNVSVSDEFVDAFIYKNWLESDYNVIKQIFDDHLPREIEIKWVISADTLKNMRAPNNWLIVKELSPEERFLPTTYNSYSAVLEQMNLPKEKFPTNIVDDAVYLNEDEVREVLWRFFTEEELKDVNINFSDELIDWVADWRYGRDWMKRFLDFIRNPEELTPYHETVHMYLDMFVNDEDKIALLDTVWKDNKKEIQKYIRDKNYKQSDFFKSQEEANNSKFSFFNKVTEEWIADNFINFVKNPDIKLKKETKNIFQKIWDFLTSWWKDRTEEQLDALNQLYSDIYNRVRPEGGIIKREWGTNYYQSAFHRTKRRPTIDDYDINTIRDNDWRVLYRTYINRNLFSRWELTIDRISKDWKVNLNELASEINILRDEKRLSTYEYQILKSKIEDCRKDSNLWLEVPRRIFDEVLWEWKRDYPVIAARDWERYSSYWRATEEGIDEGSRETRVYVIRKLEDVSKWRFTDSAHFDHFPITTENYAWRYPESLFHARHEEIVDKKWPQIYRITEIQSDTFQHGSSYRDAIAAFWGDEKELEELNKKRAEKWLWALNMLPKSKRISEEEFKLMRETWADRAMSEEINNAINNWFNKVQFPYYWTIRKIEWFWDFYNVEEDIAWRTPYFVSSANTRVWWMYSDVPVSLLWKRWERLIPDKKYVYVYGPWENYYVPNVIGLPPHEWLYKTAKTVFNEYMDWPWKKLLDENYEYTEDDYNFIRECLVSTNRAPVVWNYDNLDNTALREEFNEWFNVEWFWDRIRFNERLKDYEWEKLSKEEWRNIKIWWEPNLERLDDGTYKLKNDEYTLYANERIMKVVANDNLIVIPKESIDNYERPNTLSKKEIDEKVDKRIAKSKKLLDKAWLIAKWAIPGYEDIIKINEKEKKWIVENIFEYWWEKFIGKLLDSFDKSNNKLEKLIASADEGSSVYISQIKDIQSNLVNMVDDVNWYIDAIWWIENINDAGKREVAGYVQYYIDGINYSAAWWTEAEQLKHANVVSKYTEDYIPRFKNLVKDMFWKEAYIEGVWDNQWLTVDLKDIDTNNAPYIAYHKARNDRTKNIWNPTLTEDNVIEDILIKYEKAVEKWISGKEKMTVKESQDLKQQASYALNTAVQDLILSRYWSILNASDREWLLWLWYNLKLASNKEELEVLKEANRQTMANFRRRWWEVAQEYNTLLRNPEELDKRLMESWRVYTERNWQQAIVDVWEELENSIKSIPDTAWEITALKQMDSKNIRWLKPKQAYALLKTIDLVKNNITRWNFYTQLMYQLNPQLRRAENWLNFFQTFKVVDMWWWVWVPWSLTNNATAWYVQAWKLVTDASDLAYKAEITKAIYNWYIKTGKELTQKDLENIVWNVLKWTVDTEYAQHYIDAFAPYVSLKWLSPDVVTYVNNLLNTESKEVQGLLKEVWADLDSILDMSVILDDGSSVKVWDMINWNVNWWQERLFWWLSNDGEEKFFISKDRASNVKEEIKSAYSWYNWVDLVTQNESHVITSLFWNARKILQRDTNTKKFIEFDNSIWWQNDILKQLMELHLFWWWKYWKNATWVQRTINWLSKIYSTWVNSRWWFDPKKWWEVQLLYETYYSRSLDELKNMPLPEDWTHQIALELAKYFKELEMRLGSKTWATWVSMDTSVNRAFWNLWSIVRNIHTDKGVYSLMNKIGNNQVLWLFKFTQKWDSAYNDFLYKLSTDNIWWAASTTYAYNYREFVNWNMDEITRQFNTMFGSNFSKNDVNIILQWLGWYQIVNKKWNRRVRIISNYISWFWWRTARLLMTYPYQLFTIYNQIFAYNVKANAFKRALWVEDVWHTNDIRKELWILEWTYVDFDWLTSWIKRWVSTPIKAVKDFMLDVVWRDSDEVAKAWIEFDDWIMWLYWKTTSYVSNNYDIIKMSQLFDSVRDNANNIIDAAHAQTFKWLAFLKALQKNDYIQFMNADAFKAFMERTDISQAVKDKLLDRVNIYSNRIFQDMLGIGFSWLDKVYWWNALTDFLSWILWMINFKWAWGTNIFRQTFEKLGSLLKVWIEYTKWNRAAADEMWSYIIRTPEFSNLSTCLWWDLVMSWKMAKFAKNWQLPDDESEVELMDFVWWVSDNIWFISQQWQWLQSFWWMRPFTEAIRWMYYNMDKWVMWALWAWNNAFWSTLASNVWRNWKPVTFITDALLVAETDWIDAGWKYIEDNRHTISAWTMRYMVEEWYNAYWVNNSLTTQRWWIPALLVWEQYANSDTAFMYDVNKWNSSWLQLLSNAINTSQLFKLWKDLVQWTVQWGYRLFWEEAPNWTKSKKWVYNLMSIKDDLDESQTFKELWDTWKPMPKTQKQLQNLLDDYMKPNYPGWYKAYIWLQNYIETWTLNGKWWDEWNYYDKWLEQFYKKIEEKKPWELKDFLERFSDAYLWDPNSEEARIDFYNWAREWLNRMSDDPDYKLYASAMFKWHLNNLYYEVLDKEAEIYTWERTGMWYTKDQTKVSRSDIDKMKNVKERINERFLAQHYDEMYAADMELMQHNFYQWIADELEPEVANWYFSQQKKKNWEWNETDDLEWVLKGNIKNQIQDEIFFEKAIKDWRWEDAMTYASIMTQALAYNDDTWETRAAMCDYYADRIINSDWPATVKQSAFSWLIHNNEKVFTYDSDLAEKYWEYYDAATQYKNEVLHNINERVIENMNNLAIALHEDTSETTKTASSGSGLSNLLSKLSWSLESSQTGKVQYNPKKPDNRFLAIPIKWLSAMWYKSPKKPKDFNFEIVYKSKGYDPKTKTLWPITPPKKNKAVKAKSTRKMTQKEENELDLI